MDFNIVSLKYNYLLHLFGDFFISTVILIIIIIFSKNYFQSNLLYKPNQNMKKGYPLSAYYT